MVHPTSSRNILEYVFVCVYTLYIRSLKETLNREKCMDVGVHGI